MQNIRSSLINHKVMSYSPVFSEVVNLIQIRKPSLLRALYSQVLLGSCTGAITINLYNYKTNGYNYQEN